MSVLVRTPHTEISLTGERAERVLKYLRRNMKINLLDSVENEAVDIRDTGFWKSTGSGELLMGYRLKARLTQQQLAERCDIVQTVISDYEKGKRKITPKAMLKLAAALNTTPEHLMP